MENIQLPPFVKFYNIGNEYLIVRKGNTFTIPQNNNKTFNHFEHAYDYIQAELEGKPIFNIDNILTEGIENPAPHMITANNRMFFSTTYKNLIEEISNDYKHFLETTHTQYDKHPDNIIYCWNFLNNHPCFWSRNPEHPDYWHTANGIDHLHISMWEENNTPTILLETGPYEGGTVDEIFYEHIHPTIDPDLIVEAATFEEALIMLAAKVRNHYKLSGEKN